MDGSVVTFIVVIIIFGMGITLISFYGPSRRKPHCFCVAKTACRTVGWTCCWCEAEQYTWAEIPPKGAHGPRAQPQWEFQSHRGEPCPARNPS